MAKKIGTTNRIPKNIYNNWRGKRKRELERKRERDKTKQNKNAPMRDAPPSRVFHHLPNTGVTTGCPQKVGDKMPTTPASGAPRPDVVVGLLNCNAAHMPDVSEHPGGPMFLWDRRPKPPVGYPFGALPRFTKRNAIFTPTPVNLGYGLPPATEATPNARGEREREREAAAGIGEGSRGGGWGLILYGALMRPYKARKFGFCGTSL